MIFAVAMAGCVLTTPLVTWLASWVGAIDRPDQFRRIHQGAIPRLGGFALAMGVAAGHRRSPSCTSLSAIEPSASLQLSITGPCSWPGSSSSWSGFVDDTRSLGPRTKLLGQALAVLALYLGGIRIQSIEVLSLNLDLGFPSSPFQRAGISR